MQWHYHKWNNYNFNVIFLTDEHENLIQRLSEHADGDLDAGSLTTSTNDHHHQHHQQLIDSLTQHQQQHQQHIRNNNNHHNNHKKRSASSETSPTKSDSSKEENNNLKPVVGSSNSLMGEHSPLSPDMKRRRFDDTDSPVPSDVSFVHTF